MCIITGSPRPIPNLQQYARSSHFSTARLITVIAVLITSQPISLHALPPALGRAQGSRASPGNSHRPACVSKGKEMTQAGKKSKSRKRHNSSWACTSLQPGPHTALALPRPRARGPARSARSGLPRRAWALDPPPLLWDAPTARPGRRLPSGLRRPGPPRGAEKPEPPPGPRSR